MRRPAFQRSVRGHQVSGQYSLPAPVGGWNALDAIGNMPETDAVKLENWFPTTTDIELRPGYGNHVTGINNQVESLMVYNRPNGTRTLFAAAGGNFYDVTSAGAVGSAVVSGQSNNRWQSLNFTLPGGTSYLCCFNGEDSPQYWNGTSWTAITGVSTPAITGLTTSEIQSASVHNRRMWFVQKDSLKAWYLPVNSVGGAAKALDLSGLCKRGGFLVAIGTWTLDSGEGIDDAWVAVTSEGQIVVATGTDPSSASTWQFTGVWDVGAPLGIRPMLKYKGDILIVLEEGVFPLSVALIGSQVQADQALTYKISKEMTTAAVSYADNFGWELLHIPNENQLILNVPVKDGSEQEQYVMNTISGAWARFTGIEANCWALMDGEAYFGTNGEVVKYGGRNDDESTNISADMQQAFSYFGERGRLKHFKSMRPIMQVSGATDLRIAVNVDYDDTEPGGVLSLSPAASAIWGTSMWGSGVWGGLTLLRPWQTVKGVGTSGSVRFKAVSQTETRLQATDHVFEYGGVIG